MAYVKQNFVKGQILTAEHMNHIEDGIVAAADAQSLGGVAAGSYALKTDVAPDSALLGGKTPAYYLQPRNLLDNSDFRNPVNQRGASSYSGSVYSIDRWKLWTTATTLTINDGYITNAEREMVQLLESVDTTKTYTLAGCTSDGVIHILQGKFDGNNYVDAYLRFVGDSSVYCVGLKPNSWVWAALYEGSYTADTLPPYVPKENEIISCREYYREYGDDGIYCYCYTNDYLTGFDFDIPMRIAPSILECSILRLNGFESMNVGASSIMTAKGVTYIHCPGAVAGEWYRITNLKLSADL